MKPRHLAAVVLSLPIALLTLSETRPLAAPGLAITSVAGPLVHGSTVTIAGGRFGTKPAAAPIKYDDFQNLSLGQDVSANGWITGGYYHPAASNANLRGGTPFTRNAHSRFSSTSEGAASNFYLAGLTNSRYYVDGWMYFHVDSDPQPSNIKPIRFHQDTAGAPNLYLNFYDPGFSDSVACGRDMTPDNTDGDWFGNKPSREWYDRWIHIQFLIDAGTGNGNSDGSCIVYLDGALRYNHRNIRTIGSGFYGWPEVYVGNYVRSDPHGDAHAYWESVYVDGSWARVELGNAATYAACTHREIQIPTSWSDSSISVRLNRGSFSSFNGLYVFVVDADGNVSPGFAWSPGAPANLRIIH